METMSVWIDGEWREGGGRLFERVNPGTEEVVWVGRWGTGADVERAVEAARKACAGWVAMGFERRAGVLERFAEIVKKGREALAGAISQETGKPYWEALTEADAVAGKIGLTLAAVKERAGERAVKGGRTRYKAHGVVGVIGPFNLPAHLPNGHIAPALAMGNAVVFKPSELAPLSAAMMCEMWGEAGLPRGVLNMVVGGGEVGAALAGHEGVDGVYFTGSRRVGVMLAKAVASEPEKILALEMGGNNPLVVWHTGNITPAVYDVIQSAYITSGQRCTCARRLIISKGPEGDDLLHALAGAVKRLAVGSHVLRPEVFMGPVISPEAGRKVLDAQVKLMGLGGRVVVPVEGVGGNEAMLRPGLVDVTDVAPGRIADEEVFGPLLTVTRVGSFEEALEEANRTRYGLAAGLLSDDPALFEVFYAGVRAGVVNFNRPTTGASGAMAFGGVGWSGNHRPSGYFAVDYCGYPVATLSCETLALPEKLLPGVVL
jgi:succinylglutamic semialdehyde dehydrogenase